jgi:hypothetical protein
MARPAPHQGRDRSQTGRRSEMPGAPFDRRSSQATAAAGGAERRRAHSASDGPSIGGLKW